MWSLAELLASACSLGALDRYCAKPACQSRYASKRTCLLLSRLSHEMTKASVLLRVFSDCAVRLVMGE